MVRHRRLARQVDHDRVFSLGIVENGQDGFFDIRGKCGALQRIAGSGTSRGSARGGGGGQGFLPLKPGSVLNAAPFNLVTCDS